MVRIFRDGSTLDAVRHYTWGRVADLKLTRTPSSSNVLLKFVDAQSTAWQLQLDDETTLVDEQGATVTLGTTKELRRHWGKVGHCKLRKTASSREILSFTDAANTEWRLRLGGEVQQGGGSARSPVAAETTAAAAETTAATTQDPVAAGTSSVSAAVVPPEATTQPLVRDGRPPAADDVNMEERAKAKAAGATPQLEASNGRAAAEKIDRPAVRPPAVEPCWERLHRAHAAAEARKHAQRRRLAENEAAAVRALPFRPDTSLSKRSAATTLPPPPPSPLPSSDSASVLPGFLAPKAAEAIRERVVREATAECTFSPALIAPPPSVRMSRRNGSVFERLSRPATQPARPQQQQSCRDHSGRMRPSFKVTRPAPQRVLSLHASHAAKEARKEAARRAKRAAEAAAVDALPFAPDTRLTRRVNAELAVPAPSDAGGVHERLFEAARQRAALLERKRRDRSVAAKSAEEHQCTFRPKINRSWRTRRSGGGRGSPGSPGSPGSSGSSGSESDESVATATASTAASDRAIGVGERLFALSRSTSKQETRARAAAAEGCTFAPQLVSKPSRSRLCDAAGKQGARSVVDRLYSDAAQKRREALSRARAQADAECTFVPTLVSRSSKPAGGVARTSRERAGRRGCGSETAAFERLYNDARGKELRLEAAQAAQAAKPEPECTFAPTLISRAAHTEAPSGEAPQCSHAGERLYRAAAKTKKKSAARILAEVSAECTFAPALVSRGANPGADSDAKSARAGRRAFERLYSDAQGKEQRRQARFQELYGGAPEPGWV